MQLDINSLTLGQIREIAAIAGSLAEAHYGKGKGDKNNIIFEANRPMLASPDKIYPGQVLRIPDLAEA